MTEQQREFTAEELAAAREQIAGQQSGFGPSGQGAPDADVAAQLAAGQAAAGEAIGGTIVDEDAIRSYIEAQVRAQVTAALRAAGAEPPGEPLVNTAVSLRNLLKTQDSMSPVDHGQALRLADELVDAAENAVESGDTGAVRNIAEQLTRWLKRAGNPGPGDHPYYRQAADFAEFHIPDAADQVRAPVKAPALTTTRPAAKVIAGNVTG